MDFNNDYANIISRVENPLGLAIVALIYPVFISVFISFGIVGATFIIIGYLLPIIINLLAYIVTGTIWILGILFELSINTYDNLSDMNFPTRFRVFFIRRLSYLKNIISILCPYRAFIYSSIFGSSMGLLFSYFIKVKHIMLSIYF